MAVISYLAPPAHGHVNPALPLMAELVRRGHRLIAYNTAEFQPQIERAGAEFRAYPAMAMSADTIARAIEGGNLSNTTRLLLRTTEQLVPFLLDELGRERPDLVLFDAIALWGKIAATKLGLRAAASIGLFLMDDRLLKPRDLLWLLGQALPNLPAILMARRRLRQRYGAAFPTGSPLFPVRDRLNLVFASRGIQPDTPLIDATFRFVGPSIAVPPADEPLPFALPHDVPIVYISLGTIHSSPAFYRACFTAFADVPAHVVLAVGTRAPVEALGPIPANFTVRQSVPQLAVLRRAAAFVTHGGMNSVQEGLYFGVPLVLVPNQFEQLFNARCVAATGAGLIIDSQVFGRPITPAALRRVLDALLSEPDYRAAAGAVQRTLRATGGFRAAADAVEAYLLT